MTRVIAIMNQHGQVGKTTTTLNLGIALASLDKKVTLIDLDPNGQLSEMCQLESVMAGIHQVLKGEVALVDVKNNLVERVDVVAVGQGLINFETVTDSIDRKQRGFQLKRAINMSNKQEDFILIDCPAKLGLLALNGLLAADEVMIPLKSSYASAQGLARIISVFKRLKKLSGGAKLWLIFTQVDHKDNIMTAVKNSVTTTFPKRVFQTDILQDNGLLKHHLNKQAMLDHVQSSQGVADYFSLAQDVIEGRVH